MKIIIDVPTSDFGEVGKIVAMLLEEEHKFSVIERRLMKLESDVNIMKRSPKLEAERDPKLE